MFFLFFAVAVAVAAVFAPDVGAVALAVSMPVFSCDPSNPISVPKGAMDERAKHILSGLAYESGSIRDNRGFRYIGRVLRASGLAAFIPNGDFPIRPGDYRFQPIVAEDADGITRRATAALRRKVAVILSELEAWSEAQRFALNFNETDFDGTPIINMWARRINARDCYLGSITRTRPPMGDEPAEWVIRMKRNHFIIADLWRDTYETKDEAMSAVKNAFGGYPYAKKESA